MTFAIHVVVSALVISFASWLSGRFPTTAGFMVAMPLATMLVLPLSYQQHGSVETTTALARSILIAIPVSVTFFLPFLFAERLQLGFWPAYALGCLVLPIGFFAHRAVARVLLP